MIDNQGYRHNVCMVVTNADNQVLMGKRIGSDSWQFPQGGISQGESATEAVFRELAEEVGLYKSDVELIARTNNWLHYRIPPALMRRGANRIIGQKQLWFLLKIKCSDSKINVEQNEPAEFEDWCWTNYWQPIEEVINFKRTVYEDGLKALAPVAFNNEHQVPAQYKRRLFCSTIRLHNLALQE